VASKQETVKDFDVEKQTNPYMIMDGEKDLLYIYTDGS
jgi:hypothetical protein